MSPLPVSHQASAVVVLTGQDYLAQVFALSLSHSVLQFVPAAIGVLVQAAPLLPQGVAPAPEVEVLQDGNVAKFAVADQ